MLRPFSQFLTPPLLSTLFLSFSILFFQVTAQQYPDKIDGYKVQRSDVSIIANDDPDAEVDGTTVVVDIDEPQFSRISLFGVSLEIGGRVTVAGQNGVVDYMTFHNIEINGTKVDIEKYSHSFEFKNGKLCELGEPINVFVGSVGTLRAAINELTNSKEKWRVTGTVLVFGRFKKSLFKFKRVIPVAFDFTIDNPVTKK